MSDSTLSYERRGAIAIVAIDAPPHNPMSLAFMDALESLVAGRVVNQITVDPDVAKWARVALDQMLALPGETSRD